LYARYFLKFAPSNDVSWRQELVMAESNREQIAKLEAIYAKNPGGRVFTHLADAYRKAGELDRARSILQAGIVQHPDYASAHVVMGRIQMDLGALVEAAQTFLRVLELDPENRVALRALGDLARRDRPAEALVHYRELQALDPSDEDLTELIEILDQQLQKASDPSTDGPEAESRGGQPWVEPVVLAGTSQLPPERDRIEGEPVAPPEAGLAEGEFASYDAAEPPGAGLVTALPSSWPEPYEIDELFSGTANEHRTVDGVKRDLPTETLAELYRTQGFYARSGEVYRALLQRRPDDPHLRRRLQEVEELERRAREPVTDLRLVTNPTTIRPAGRRPESADLPAGEFPSAEAEEAWVEGLASAWTREAGADPQAAPYAWDPEPEEDAGGATLLNYLSGVLSWQPTGQTGPRQHSERTAGSAREPDDSVARGSADESEPKYGPNWWGGELPSWAEPNGSPGTEGARGSDRVAPAQSAGNARRGGSEPGAQSAPRDGVEDAFEEWFAPDVAPAAAELPVEGLDQVPAGAEEDESDEDLEMFRSWLQSLKR
jgi:tetratricopeptide (TPR) repeat protein